jgi:hypothetical protein
MAAARVEVWAVEEGGRVFPQDPPPRGGAGELALCAAQGEYVCFQVGLRAEAALKEVTAELSPLRGPGGAELAGAETRWVGLVPVPQDAFDPAGAERPDLVPGWYPDPLLETPPWSGANPPRSAAVHMTLRVPRGTPAGRYRGRVRVTLAGAVRATLPVSLEVWPFAIPRRPTFHVTNWFQSDCVTKWHRCEAWSERHWRLLELYAATMEDYRQDTITTPTFIGNFHNSDPMCLVGTTRAADGSYRFDFRRLERWVRLFDRHGFRYFEMWHLAAQAHGRTAPRFAVRDEKTGRVVWHEEMRVLGREYRAVVGAFLRALSRWLDRRGLSDRFLLHVYDEPKRETWAHYAAVSAFFRENAPKLKHIDAISASDLITQFGADIDIPVPLTTHLEKDEYYRARARDGRKPVWWYTCCGPGGRYANRFVCQPLITTRILPWQAFVLGIGGYLHWGYNFWHRCYQHESGWPGISDYADHTLVNPYREHPPRWAVGDAAIVYPHPRWWEEHGPVSSLRYEAMRAGLQDYELLRLLRGVAARPRTAAVGGRARALLRLASGPLAGSLTEFTRDGVRLARARREIGRCIAGNRGG